jgi:hypothetical protein
MGFFFFDESVHQRGGFALGAFVYTRSDPTATLKKALKAAGLKPGIDEFKSGAHVGRNPKQAKARDYLQNALFDCGRIALVVVPANKSDALGREALTGLRTILELNKLDAGQHKVYLDEGLFSSHKEALDTACSLGLQSTCTLHPESDSRNVLGLQLADLVAHTGSIMLLEHQGIITKTVKAGPNSGYDPDLDIELGFELWTTIRYNFFSGDVPDPETWSSQLDFQVEVEPYGLYISPLCDPALAEAVRQRFGHMYLGCIH